LSCATQAASLSCVFEVLMADPVLVMVWKREFTG